MPWSAGLNPLPRPRPWAIQAKFITPGGSGSNPEQLSTASYSDCFESAVRHVARDKTIALKAASATAHVGIDPRRFNEFLASAPGLPGRLLTERLHELAEQEIVERVPSPDISPIAIKYRLTELGRDLEVVVRAISTWTRLWRSGPGGRFMLRRPQERHSDAGARSPRR